MDLISNAEKLIDQIRQKKSVCADLSQGINNLPEIRALRLYHPTSRDVDIARGVFNSTESKLIEFVLTSALSRQMAELAALETRIQIAEPATAPLPPATPRD